MITMQNNKLVAANHTLLYQGITEQLLFSNVKYERMDMSFIMKLSSIDYGRKHRVILIGAVDNQDKNLYENIGNAIRDKYGILLMTVWEKLIIGILPERLIELTEIKKIYHFLEERYGTIKIAASTIKEKLEDSHIGLQEATRTYDMIDTMKKYEENLMLYEDLGIFGLLYDLNETTVFESYYNGVFQNLWRYDEKNEGHLFETLECYFRNNCDKAKTAEELFIHENTLRYRLHQIEDIMHKDLKNVNVITDIVTALKVRRMIQILDSV